MRILIACSALFGNIFLHLAVDGPSVDIRRLALASLTKQASQSPEIVARIVSAALKVYLTKESTPTKTSITIDDTDTKQVSKEGRLCAFLLTCAATGEDVEVSIREKLVVELIVISHHSALGQSISPKTAPAPP